MTHSSARRLRQEAAQFLFGLIALTLLTWLCIWLGLRPISTTFLFLILIVLLSFAGSFLGAIALAFVAVAYFFYFFAPRIVAVRMQYLDDVITISAFLITSLTVTGLIRRLRERWDGLANVLDAMPALVWNSSPAGLADFSNQRFRDYTGLSSDQLRGWGWVNALHPDDCSAASWRAALVAGEPFEREARVRNAAGEYRWFVLRLTPLRNERGTIVRWCGAASDVEDRRRTEQALRRSEAYLAEAQKLSHTGSWAYDTASRHLVYCSEENFRLFGYDPASGLPSNADWSARLHPEDREAALEIMRRQLENPCAYEMDYRVVHPDGTIKYIHSVTHPVFNSSGDLVQFVGTHIDMTERKQAEQARLDAQNELAHANRVATVGQLTASIAHEVNQPIGALVTNAHAAQRLMKADPPDLDQVYLALDDIIKDGRRISEVIDRIRALVKKRQRQSELLDVNEVITEAIALTRGEVLKSDVSLEIQLTRDLPLIQGDRVQLQQVITNLMVNAIEAMTSADIPDKRLQIATDMKKENRILVTVCDSGPMLKPECLERFFEAFYSTKSNGMGIGLSICRSIVETHGGQIWATANADGGATLHVSLPASRDADNQLDRSETDARS